MIKCAGCEVYLCLGLSRARSLEFSGNYRNVLFEKCFFFVSCPVFSKNINCLNVSTSKEIPFIFASNKTFSFA